MEPGNPIDLFPQEEPLQVVTEDAAFLATSILSDNKARVPAFGENSPLTLSRPVAAKTGTTNSYRDNWTMGFTRYLVAGVWAGNSDGRPMRGVTGVTGAAPIWNKFMEGVIANPAMLKTLGAPEGITGWEFPPSEGVDLRLIDCPTSLKCPQSLEFFSRGWEAKQARTGVQSDSVMSRDKVMSVNAGGRTVGVCSDTNGAERTHYRMPEGLGLLAPPEVVQADAKLAISPAIPLPLERATEVRAVPAIVPEQTKKERQEVLRWTGANGALLHLGPCSEVAPLVAEVFGTSSISFGRMSPMVYSTPGLATDTLTETVALTGTVAPTETLAMTESEPVVVEATPEPVAAPIAADGSQYLLTAAGPGGGCSGNYIVGAVVDAGGAPQPGVRVIAVDQYGNRAETASKNGSSDFGRFDFGVAGSQNNYYVTVIDGGGNPISATAIIVHQQPAEGNACYWVQFQASSS